MNGGEDGRLEFSNSMEVLFFLFFFTIVIKNVSIEKVGNVNFTLYGTALRDAP